MITEIEHTANSESFSMNSKKKAFKHTVQQHFQKTAFHQNSDVTKPYCANQTTVLAIQTTFFLKACKFSATF